MTSTMCDGAIPSNHSSNRQGSVGGVWLQTLCAAWAEHIYQMFGEDNVNSLFVVWKLQLDFRRKCVLHQKPVISYDFDLNWHWAPELKRIYDI